jgi:hypothetical protein
VKTTPAQILEEWAGITDPSILSKELKGYQKIVEPTLAGAEAEFSFQKGFYFLD